MSESNYKPRGDGVVQGDDKNIPDAGTRRGFVDKGEPFGADVGVQATNRLGGFHGSCASDPMDDCYNHKRHQWNAGERSRPFDGGGKRMSGTDSDPMADDTADNPRV